MKHLILPEVFRVLTSKQEFKFSSFTLIVTALILFSGCEKERVPELSTLEVTEITQTTAVSGGTIIHDGGAVVTSRGVCWSISPEPTIIDNKIEDVTGSVSFAISIIDLEPNTTYYVRAYATNSAGIGYGNTISFTTFETIRPRSVIITNKADTLLKLVYNDFRLISHKTMENNLIEETEYYYDSNGLLTGLRIFNLTNNQITYKVFSYDSSNRIRSINVNRNWYPIEEIRTLIYNEAGKLIQIKAFLPESFEYVGNNVLKNGRVDINRFIWIEYVYSYDNMVNPIYNIGLPLIAAKQLSPNNRKSKIAYWDDWGSGHSDAIRVIDTIYTSFFVYNNDNKPIIEYRKHKSGVDTLMYLYK
jgi:hypothetical protein